MAKEKKFLWLIFTITAILKSGSAAEAEGNYDVTAEWSKFKIGKTYESSEEEVFRRDIFAQTLAKINTHNSNPSNTYQLGINQFSDLSPKELRVRFRNNVTRVEQPHPRFIRSLVTDLVEALPLTLDYRTLGQVTSVKNQGSCPATYAFTAVGALENLMIRKKLSLSQPDLSEQEVVDCSYMFEPGLNRACDGGSVWVVFKFAREALMVSESEYPYTSGRTQVRETCRPPIPATTPNQPTTNLVTNYFFVQMTNENELKSLLINHGPVIAVTVHVDSITFRQYRSGIYNNAECVSNYEIEMLLVGYGTSADGTEFWILKGALGTGWGEQGYMRLKKGLQSTCGVYLMSRKVVYVT